MFGDQLAFPMAERMSTRCAHRKSKSIGYPGNGFAQHSYIYKCFIYVCTDIRTYFYNGLMHLGFDLILYDLLTFLYDFLFMASQFESFWIHDHVFFFYS